MRIFDETVWDRIGFFLLGFLLIGEVTGIFFLRRTAFAQESVVARVRREWRTIIQAAPTPTAENAAAMIEQARQSAAILTSWEEAIGGKPTVIPDTTSAPKAPTDAFFDLAAFVEAMRQRAKESGVALRTDERFGFSAYINAGPEHRLVAAVFRQRQVCQQLLEALFEARPAKLLSIQREEPDDQEGARRINKAAATLSRDCFVLPAHASVRTSGEVSSQAFRVSFVGQTNELRAFLSALSKGRVPAIVRNVEVEPLPLRDATPLVQSAVAGEKPLVLAQAFQCTVTVEFIELKPVAPRRTEAKRIESSS